MKKTALFNIVFISLFLLIISISVKAQWQQDQAYNFKINIPYNWSKQSHMDGADKIYDYNSPDQNAAVQLRVFDATPQLTLDILCQAYESNYLPAGTKKQSLVNHTSVNGIPGKQGLYILYYNNIEVAIAVFYVIKNNKGYVLNTMIPSNLIAQKGEEVKRITQSFVIDGFEPSANVSTETKSLSGKGGIIGKSINKLNQKISNDNSVRVGIESKQGVKPCPGIPSFEYDGQIYHTIQMGNQCWMAENLNVGKMIISTKYAGFQSNNKIIEKYCYEDKEENCTKWGALYLWKEMMQYQESDNGKIGHVRGICPSGWHIPTDLEWSELEGWVDSQYGVGDPAWNTTGTRGTDVGKILKAKQGWEATLKNLNTNGIDSFGFSILGVPGKDGAYFTKPGCDVNYWTATAWNGTSYVRRFSRRFDNVNRVNMNYNAANPVRCIKN